MARPKEKPVKKTRLAQMLLNEQIKLGLSEAEIGSRYGWSKQAFNSWKSGVVPRRQMYADLAKFLRISVEDLADLASEAVISTGKTKLPDLGAPIMGRGTGDFVVLEEFASGYARPAVDGCFAIRVDGMHMWVNPRMRPVDGNTVLLRAGRLVAWPADGDVAGVVVLREMV